jgi:hypothetical protein
MNNLLPTICLLALLALGCGRATEQSIAPPASSAMSAPAPTAKPEAPAPTPAPDFSALLALYPVRSLPRDYAYDLTSSSKALERRPLSDDLASFLVGGEQLGDEKIRVAKGEQLFAYERMQLEGNVVALVTYLKGTKQQAFVLSTHMPDGELISHTRVWMRSETLSYGYSSTLSINQGISRGIMITNDAGELDVDSFEEFIIESDGRISMTE